MASSSFNFQAKRTSEGTTSNVASHEKMKRNFLETGNANLEPSASTDELLQKLDDAEELQASAACLLELSLSGSSKLVVTNDTAHAANPAQEEINKENVEKRDRKPNSLLKPEEEYAFSWLSHKESSPKLGFVEKEAADVNHTIKHCGVELIGLKVKVWWPQDERFRRGKFTYFNSDERLHQVDYDDGVKEFLDLSEELWQLEQEADSSPGASTAMFENAGISLSHPSKRKHMVATQIGNNKKVIKRESNSDEDQAIDQKTAAASASKLTTPRSSEYQKWQKPPAGPPSASSVQDGNACNELVDVSGYLVKASIAPTLWSIFSKYGDIASNCLFKHHNTRSPFFEVICNVIKKLQSNNFGVIASEVKEMISEISDAAEAKMDVSWLQKLLVEIDQVEEVGKKSSWLMELRVNSNLIVKAARKDLEERRIELMAAEKQFKEAKCRMEALEHVKAKVENDVLELLAAEQAWRRRVDELL